MRIFFLLLRARARARAFFSFFSFFFLPASTDSGVTRSRVRKTMPTRKRAMYFLLYSIV